MRIKLTAGVLLLLLGGGILAACAIPDRAVTATATVAGYGGAVSVTVTVERDRLVDVQVRGDGEAEGAQALGHLQTAALEAGSFEIDAVSGATITSNAVLGAGEIALEEALRD